MFFRYAMISYSHNKNPINIFSISQKTLAIIKGISLNAFLLCLDHLQL